MALFPLLLLWLAEGHAQQHTHCSSRAYFTFLSFVRTLLLAPMIMEDTHLARI